MLLDPSEDQEFFRQTTERFLVETVPPDALRGLRDDPVGFDAAYWRQGAELGWTSLLVDESAGGGTVSGAGLVDLSLVAYEFGRHAAPGPLLATNVVASALSRAGTHGEVLAALLSGEGVATWCAPTPGDVPGVWQTGASVVREGSGFVVRGTVRPVEAAVQAGHLLVTGDDGSGGLTQVLVPVSAPGVSVTTMKTVDLTRRFGAVTFDDVRVDGGAVVGATGGASADVAWQFLVAISVLNAESVGCMQTGFDMTVEWAFDRYSFGRPLASYQALKHRFADMMTWLEGSHATADVACRAVADGSEFADELSSAAKAYISQYGGELLQDCVQMHGGIGITFEHDLHIYLRRLTVNRSLAGSASLHHQRIAALVDARQTAAA